MAAWKNGFPRTTVTDVLTHLSELVNSAGMAICSLL